jgi:hypothetical protein
MCSCAQILGDYISYDTVFLFLLDRQAWPNAPSDSVPALRFTWDLTVDDGSWTDNRNDSLTETEYSFVPTCFGQVGKTAPYLWVLSVEHASQFGA